MPQKKSFYAQTPAVKAKKIAGVNPVGSVEHPGARHLKMVPGYSAKKPPGRTTGLGVPHGYGHPPHAKQGHLRLSAHPGAHQVGYSAKVTKVPK